jgi:hypothetical protein
MGKSVIMRAGLLGAAIFISAAGAAWEIYWQSDPIILCDLDFDARPVGYLSAREDFTDGSYERVYLYRWQGSSWDRIFRSQMGVDYGGLDVNAAGDGAFIFIAPPYTGDGNWDTYVKRFRANGALEDLAGAPRMRWVTAVAVLSYDDIWFAGFSEDHHKYIVTNYTDSRWVIYDDPSDTFVAKLYLFNRNDGWAFAHRSTIYRFNGTRWYFAGNGPTSYSFCGKDFRSPAEIWATGSNEAFSNHIYRYDGGSWTRKFTPGTNLSVNDVAMWDSRNGWAVGTYYQSPNRFGRIWRCREGAWVEYTCPISSSVKGVEVVSATETWAISYRTLLRHLPEPGIVAASLGRVKALYAEVRGSDSNAPPTYASRVPYTPPPAAASRPGRNADADSTERPADAAD